MVKIVVSQCCSMVWICRAGHIATGVPLEEIVLLRIDITKCLLYVKVSTQVRGVEEWRYIDLADGF